MNFADFLTRYHPRCFYHFTDRRNIGSIRACGFLYSYVDLVARGVEIPAPGGNDWSRGADRSKDLDLYVHLCFFPEHPMEYRARLEGRLKETVFLQIDPSVLNSPQVRFTADVSNKSGARLLTFEEAVEQLDFGVIYGKTEWRDPEIRKRRHQAKKYEILVPNQIPVHQIKNLPRGTETHFSSTY